MNMALTARPGYDILLFGERWIYIGVHMKRPQSPI
jgi:hypothetical protein